MPKIRIEQNDILEWAKSYEGSPFHAILCDPPYNLATITKRFGNPNSAPAQYGRDGAFSRVSKGFMGKEWDSDVAFNPEVWYEMGKHLYPGAFGLAFMGSRTYHRAATAIEDAGFIVHPMIGWIQSQGFPKATRIDTQIDRAAGAERRVVGKIKNPGSTNPRVAMHNGWQENPDLTEPSTEMAKIWGGYRYGLQALKPCLEPIIMFQKPYEGKPVESITNTGAGALNISATKFSKDRSFAVNRFKSGMKPFGNAVDEAYETTIEDKLYPTNVVMSEFEEEPFINFFYNAKASKKEKELGIGDKNPHPTIKPIGLNIYLATLLLPPHNYAPRKLLVPFSGTGSEVIGAALAGWDFIIGVEIEQESKEISEKRVQYWLKNVK